MKEELKKGIIRVVQNSLEYVQKQSEKNFTKDEILLVEGCEVTKDMLMPFIEEGIDFKIETDSEYGDYYMVVSTKKIDEESRKKYKENLPRHFKVQLKYNLTTCIVQVLKTNHYKNEKAEEKYLKNIYEECKNENYENVFKYVEEVTDLN